MRKKTLAFATLVGLSTLVPALAHAGYPGRVSTRALGMGGALRASATGDAGPMLNPSGMALLRSYVVEGGYQYDDGAGDINGHRGHASIVDSTPEIGLAGGLYYTYLSAKPGTGQDLSGHEAGLALAQPFGSYIVLGASLKYLRLTSSLAPAPGAPRVEDTNSGFTTDVGATIRPTQTVSLAFVAYNLIDRETALAPLALGTGISFTPITNLIIAVDGVMDMQSWDLLGRGDENRYSILGGAEFMAGANLALRAGGGHDGVRENGYFSLGVSAVSEIGAIDFALQRDISGDGKATIAAISARLFVPTQ